MNYKKNLITYGVGTIGRDMIFAMTSMYLIFYLTDIMMIPNNMLAWVTGIMTFARVFDAVNDPVVGVLVDNTDTRWGKFKPWLVAGALLSGIFTILLFIDFGLKNMAFVASFAFFYIGWGISFTASDISYWSMLPALSTDQKIREKIGAFARICANIGLFAVVAGIVPITANLANALGSMKQAYLVFALIVVFILWFFQAIMITGVKQPKGIFKAEERTNIKGMITAIFKNDQLLYVAIALVLFTIGYTITTSFGLYFFKYAYGDEGMYSIFGLILGVSQILALGIFPLFSKWLKRKTLYTVATALVVLGYVSFFLSPMKILYIGISGVLLFIGQAFIQLLMLMFLTDSIEYGQLKLGKRNESVTLALQPFIVKMGGAVASGVVGITLIVSNINNASSASDVTTQGLLIMKVAMLIIPLIFILAGYLVYIFKFKIDEDKYDEIIEQLSKRGDINL